MIDYLVRIDDSHTATVTKWDGGFVMEEYHLVKRKYWKCNCPAGRYRYCKHGKMVVEEFKKYHK